MYFNAIPKELNTIIISKLKFKETNIILGIIDNYSLCDIQKLKFPYLDKKYYINKCEEYLNILYISEKDYILDSYLKYNMYSDNDLYNLSEYILYILSKTTILNLGLSLLFDIFALKYKSYYEVLKNEGITLTIKQLNNFNILLFDNLIEKKGYPFLSQSINKFDINEYLENEEIITYSFNSYNRMYGDKQRSINNFIDNNYNQALGLLFIYLLHKNKDINVNVNVYNWMMNKIIESVPENILLNWKQSISK